MIFQNTLLANESIGVGNYYQGGYIAYFDLTTKQGLIVSPTDLSGSQCAWQNQPYEAVTTSDTYGQGAQNTTNILASTVATPAAELCDAYTNQGYNDWFLPNLNELKLVFTAYSQGKLTRANIQPSVYWTSYSQAFNTAWFVDFAIPSVYANNEGQGIRDSGPSSPGPGCWVRACRYITFT